ncbi:MAG: 23S rRNA (guanosine(2251)-2'-O)-methyltransferase RlmB [Betaproteobacteria bacterium AqS2]|uniref:23S rRNA (Guanosine(2251)-2'-O)-methyltransferase RlmB n=1 Tax=Candidatus Amphirhobacter heronislandensis TaxID=1732024 RepID=A0A930UIJ1_9GAMM|nr:23S rRNA (guanosine(2251)-2'-O)-methyltransferase RlmB [Betaproteobacteria bacterium AqS2]
MAGWDPARLAAGRHAVKAAIEAGQARRVAVAAGSNRDIVAAAAAAGVPVEEVGRARLRVLAGLDKNQGVAAELAPASVVADWRQLLDGGGAPLFLVLDGVEDPRNLGACLRAAAFFGVALLLHPKRRSASLSPAARKVASGAAATVPVAPVGNLSRELRAMRDAGVAVYGTVAEEGPGVEEVFAASLPPGPLALVLGGESRGLRRLTREGCDGLLRIAAPAGAGMASLNVAVACGVCLAAVARRRGADAIK